MERREFLLTCAAAALAPSLPALPASAISRGRFTIQDGEVLSYSDPFGRDARFDDKLITIVNRIYPDLPPAKTRLAFKDGCWTEITHRSRRGNESVYRPEISPAGIGIFFPDDEEQLEIDLANNLSLLTMVMLYVERDHRAWWAERPLFRRALDSAMNKPMGWRCRIADFLWTDEAIPEFRVAQFYREECEQAARQQVNTV